MGQQSGKERKKEREKEMKNVNKLISTVTNSAFPPLREQYV
jgi:hypothetical protein